MKINLIKLLSLTMILYKNKPLGANGIDNRIALLGYNTQDPSLHFKYADMFNCTFKNHDIKRYKNIFISKKVFKGLPGKLQASLLTFCNPTKKPQITNIKGTIFNTHINRIIFSVISLIIPGKFIIEYFSKKSNLPNQLLIDNPLLINNLCPGKIINRDKITIVEFLKLSDDEVSNFKINQLIQNSMLETTTSDQIAKLTFMRKLDTNDIVNQDDFFCNYTNSLNLITRR